MKKIFGFTLLSTLLTFLVANANTMNAEKVNIEFSAIGKPSFLKIKGHGSKGLVQLQIEKNKVHGFVTFKMSSLETGIELRDKHMKDKYLEISKYPEATLILESLALPNSWTLQNPVAQTTKFTGHMTMHGQTKPVTGTFEIKNKDLKTSADFEIKLSDYNVEIPVYLGVKVADVVTIHVDFEAK